MAHLLKMTAVALLLLLGVTIPLAMPPASGTIEGVVRNDRGPIPNAKVEAQHTSGEVARAVSDSSGFFRLAGLRRGAYSLWITAPAHVAARIPQVFVEEGVTTRKDVSLRLVYSGESE